MARAQDSTGTGTWTVTFREEEPHRCANKGEVFASLAERVRWHPTGRVEVDEDVGGRSWISRFLTGLGPRIVRMHLALEWSGGVAALIFFDDAASEYRALDRTQPVAADESVRREIAHGEGTPHPADECMEVGRALEAIEEYFGTGKRPEWVEYRYVG